MQYREMNAELQREISIFLAEIAQVSDRKTVAHRSETFTQVPVLRILTVRGEVAERLKAAVC
jgi:hypothetical protein